jgi:hypothetical protein
VYVFIIYVEKRKGGGGMDANVNVDGWMVELISDWREEGESPGQRHFLSKL